ncbi:hypothetical protein CQZ99_09205 [Pseudomonas poae]|uniref:Uncharacterized protein n=2 Tax=Pseudomonas poae TaxID=200451 RepID=A0A2S9EVH0_9PSED|nr:hypothetical protein CQZ97_12835 [Pseudomonas poae]PRC20174.1 hypothetical protein CQZ99_09205 [Pseudomonas poae]
MKNEFRNTTPLSGVCAWHFPAQCERMGIFSIRTENFVTAPTAIEADHQDVRKGAMWQVPSSWRTVQVTHSGTGEVADVQVRIAGIGHRFDTRPNTMAWEVPETYWTWKWMYAPAPCASSGFLTGNNAYALFFWLVPEGAGVCSRQPGQNITHFWLSTFEFAYALKTPNPLTMSPGQYTGSLTYSMGPGMDFDFGDVVIPADNQLTLNFTLNVEHILKVNLPPGGNRVELLPEGGWQAWLNRGRRPSRLLRDQTFTIAASGRFKMNLECGLVIGNTCGLRNGEGDQVPLQVAVTLPFGLNDQYDQVVSKRPLRLDGSGTELIQAKHYVNQRPGTLHFEVDKDDMGGMLEKPGSTYSGMVTVVWDSEV